MTLNTARKETMEFPGRAFRGSVFRYIKKKKKKQVVVAKLSVVLSQVELSMLINTPAPSFSLFNFFEELSNGLFENGMYNVVNVLLLKLVHNENTWKCCFCTVLLRFMRIIIFFF